MKWLTHNALSENDMALLAGTEMLEKLFRNRLVIIYEPNDKKCPDQEMGLRDCKSPFHVRNIDKNTIEVLFENESDLVDVTDLLIQFKGGEY